MRIRIKNKNYMRMYVVLVLKRPVRIGRLQSLWKRYTLLLEQKWKCYFDWLPTTSSSSRYRLTLLWIIVSHSFSNGKHHMTFVRLVNVSFSSILLLETGMSYWLSHIGQNNSITQAVSSWNLSGITTMVWQSGLGRGCRHTLEHQRVTYYHMVFMSIVFFTELAICQIDLLSD